MSPKRVRNGVLGRQKLGSETRRAAGGTHVADRLAAVIASAIVLAVVAGAGILVVSVGSTAYHYVLDRDRLVVETVDVEGNAVLTAEEIVQLSGVRRGAAILALDLPATAARIRAHPRVAGAVVERHLPRRILVRVTERQPVGLVQEGGVLKGIDAEGAIIPLIPSREEVKAPVITGLSKGNVPPELLKESLRAIELMNPDIVTRISEVRIDPSSGLTLLTTGTPVVIRLGSGEMESKIERLRKALAIFDDRGEIKEYIDVRFQDIVTRP